MSEVVDDYLRHCRELAQLCSENGWIDNDSLRVEIQQEDSAAVVAAVKFDELIMKSGTGCVGWRLPRFGRVRLRLDGDGKVLGLTVL